MDDRSPSAGGEPGIGSEGLMIRRLGAAALDLVLVVASGLISAALLLERFPIVRTEAGGHSFSQTDQTRINSLADRFSRGYEIGDTLLAFSTRSLLLTAVVVGLAGVVVGVVLPVVSRGQSIGKRLFNLRVVGTDGSTPRPSRYLVRTIAGLADLMPVVVPGLTGFAFAASNPAQQRIGDRLARTLVVDSRPTWTTDTNVGSGIGHKIDASSPVLSETIDGLVAHPRHLLSSRSRPELNSGRQPPDLGGDRIRQPDLSQIAGAIHSEPSNTGVSQDQHHGDLVEMSDSVNVPRQPDPSATPATARRVPVEERSTNPYPKPVRLSVTEDAEGPETAESEVDEQRAGYESLALPESSLSDMPLTNTALFEALGLSPDDIAKLDAELTNAADAQTTGSTSSTTEEVIPEALRPRPSPVNQVPVVASARQLGQGAGPTSTQATPTNLSPPQPVTPTTRERVSAQARTVEPTQTEQRPLAAVPQQLQAPQPTEAPQQLQAPLAVQAQQPIRQTSPPQPHQAPRPQQTQVSQDQPIQAARVQPTQDKEAAQRQPEPGRPQTGDRPQSIRASSTGAPQAAFQQPTQIAVERRASAPAPDKRAPIWSEDWESWIYWDTTLRSWFRHDDVSGNWVAMEE